MLKALSSGGGKASSLLPYSIRTTRSEEKCFTGSRFYQGFGEATEDNKNRGSRKDQVSEPYSIARGSGFEKIKIPKKIKGNAAESGGPLKARV